MNVRERTLSVDAETLTQTPKGTQPLLPVRQGPSARQTHDYPCAGATSRPSWPNLIEVWFGTLARKSIRRGSFQNVNALVRHIGP